MVFKFNFLMFQKKSIVTYIFIKITYQVDLYTVDTLNRAESAVDETDLDRNNVNIPVEGVLKDKNPTIALDSLENIALEFRYNESSVIATDSLENLSEKFQCDQCQEEFITFDILRTHIKIHDNDKTPLKDKNPMIALDSLVNISEEFKCDECHEEFLSGDILRTHIKIHNPVRNN